MDWILFITFLLLSAFYSGSEIAFIASNQLKLLVKSREDESAAKRRYFIYNPSKFLTTTLVGNNVVMVATSSLAALVLAPHMSGAAQIVVTTGALLLLGEILPKSVGRQIPNRLASLVRIFITFSYYLFYLLVFVAELMSGFLIELLGGDKQDLDSFFKKTDLPILVREYLSKDAGRAGEQELVNRAVQIGEKKVNDLMVHRTDIVAADWDTSADELLKVFQKSGYSRIPIYKDEIDNIVGIVYLLDLLRPNVKSYKHSIRKAIFIPETLGAVKALKRLRDYQISIAMVIDEHGGIAGMITVEDLVEELFGNIIDEYDHGKRMMRKQNLSTIIADGKAEIEELNERYELDIPAGDYVTIGGFLADELGRIPIVGDKVKLSQSIILVKKADRVRVLEVEIKLTANKMLSNPKIS